MAFEVLETALVSCVACGFSAAAVSIIPDTVYQTLGRIIVVTAVASVVFAVTGRLEFQAADLRFTLRL